MTEQILSWLIPMCAVALCISAVYIGILHVRINRLYKKYEYFMRDEDGGSIERKLSVEVKELRDGMAAIEALFQEQASLKETQAGTFQKIGFVKYNAFDNIGNELSFAVTLLDGQNNGVCLSSIYGRSESRVFVKPILKGKSMASLSAEELESLNEALGDKSNEEALISATLTAKE